MPVKNALSLQFQRPDIREQFERTRREMKGALLDAGLDAALDELSDLGTALDGGVARIKRDLLGSALCWNDENKQLIAWVQQQHAGVVELGQRLLEGVNREKRDNPTFQRLAALVLYHWGESIKWLMSRERPGYDALHEILLNAMGRGCHREIFTCMADGRGQATTLEALYFRALLLDRFTSGSLTRQQVEVLDAWLWDWNSSLRGEREAKGGAVLRADLDANYGLREGRREGTGPALYLHLDPLEQQRRRIVADLHRGKIVPPHGCASELRIEEHICVLDHLRRAFRSPEGDIAQRAPRQQAAGARLEVWVGLQEILARVLGIPVGTETGRYRALNLADPSLHKEAQNTRFNDATKRYLWLADTSATGLGFEAMESDANGIEVGDLLGWRRASGAPLMVGRVIRRMPSATSGQVFLGVKLLTDCARPLKLSQAVTFDNGQADGTYLYVPGDDDSGRRDAFLVSESTYDLQATYNAHVGAEAFALKFNRVRAKGRGWILAGFEILPRTTAATPAAFDGALDFTLDLDEKPRKREREELPALDFDDPWSNEVSARLLS